MRSLLRECRTFLGPLPVKGLEFAEGSGDLFKNYSRSCRVSLQALEKKRARCAILILKNMAAALVISSGEVLYTFARRKSIEELKFSLAHVMRSYLF